MAHITDAIVVTCMDFRFQKYIDEWLKYSMKGYVFDRVSLAGSILDFYYVLKQIEISNRLHNIKKIVLINHEDCGGYGKEGTVERHKADLAKAELILEKLFPHLDVAALYLHLDGTMENWSKTKAGKDVSYPYGV